MTVFAAVSVGTVGDNASEWARLIAVSLVYVTIGWLTDDALMSLWDVVTALPARIAAGVS